VLHHVGDLVRIRGRALTKGYETADLRRQGRRSTIYGNRPARRKYACVVFKRPTHAPEDAINHGRYAAITARGSVEMQGGFRWWWTAR